MELTKQVGLSTAAVFLLLCQLGTVEADPFRRGDSNDDGVLDLSDGIFTLAWLFGGGDERLVPLLKCSVRAVLIDLPDALIVPTKALFQRDGRWYCHARDRSPFGLSARAVVRGASSGKYTVVLDGLREGDEILLPEHTQ